MDDLILKLPLELVDIIYDFTFYIKDLFLTNNYRMCVRVLRQIDSFDLTITQHKVIVSQLLGNACKGGNREIVELLLKRIKTYKYHIETTNYWELDSIFHMFTFGYQEACIKNDQNIIKMLNDVVTKNVSDIKLVCFTSFCAGGHLDKINLCFRKYPDMRIELAKCGLKSACYGGHFDIVKLLLNIIPNDDHNELLNDAIHYACMNNHVHIMKYLMGPHCSKNNSIWAELSGACRSNNMDIVNAICNKYSITKSHWWIAFCKACEGGHLDMAIFALKKYKNIMRETFSAQKYLLESVYVGGNVDILQFIIEEYKKIDVDIDLLQNQFYIYTYANIEMIQFLQANSRP